MAGSLTPIYRWAVRDGDDQPAAGALLYTYVSGTSTPAAVYNNADLDPAHAHTNPVVADADGIFPVIYLDAMAYRFFVTDADGATIYPAQDNIYDFAQVYPPDPPDIPLSPIGTCEGRLTLTSGVPVTTSDVTAATVVYFTPYGGNRIGLYDGSAWDLYAFTETSISVVGATASKPYDIFGYLSGSTLTLEKVIWTSATARFGSGAYATLLPTQDGVYVKSTDGTVIDNTRRYLGTIYINASGGQTDDSYAKRSVWNYYNQKPREMRVLEATASWTYNGTWRQANGAAGNQLDFIIGVAEVGVTAEVVGSAECSGAADNNMQVAIGLDSTSAPSTVGLWPISRVTVSNIKMPLRGAYHGYPGVGRHVLVWLEQAAAATTTWYGVQTVSQSGIAGEIQG